MTRPHRYAWPAVGLSLVIFAGFGAARQQQPDPRMPIGRPPAKSSAPAAANGQFIVVIEGAKQGRFKGEGPRDSNKDKIIGLGFNYELATSLDAATGQPAGKPRHEPLVITKEWGAASAQIFQAATTGEVLKSVALEFFRTSAAGESESFHAIKLTDARIASVKQYTEGGRYYEDVGLTFQNIEVKGATGTSKAPAQ